MAKTVSDFFANPATRLPFPTDRPTRAPLEFHRRLPGYAPSPLLDVPELARHFGVGQLWIKNESLRFGLPSFKVMGASWAAYRLAQNLLGDDLEPWATISDLRSKLDLLNPLTLVTATEGNHGRAVARVAAWLGVDAHIYIRSEASKARVEAIDGEGAKVTLVEGTYDDAVRAAESSAGPGRIVLADTADGEDQIANWVMEGYSSVFWEVDDQLLETATYPELVVVPIGVGALAAAATRHFRSRNSDRPVLVGVEPTGAACALASIRAGRVVTIPGTPRSIMAGLNTGTPSTAAWPYVSRGINLFLAVDDSRAVEAMRLLDQVGLASGETGAAALGGVIELISSPEANGSREQLGITDSTGILVICTEGVTDAAAYERLVGHVPSSSPS